jgi:hypothetical protein
VTVDLGIGGGGGGAASFSRFLLHGARLVREFGRHACPPFLRDEAAAG